MKTIPSFFFFLGLLTVSFTASAQELPFRELKFSNRAQCALDSEKPSLSSFTLIDAFNTGRMAYALAKNLETDADSLSVLAMRDFRLSIAGLQKQVMEKLISGGLPLLPLELNDKNSESFPLYRKLAKDCGEDIFCPGLRDYLSKVWQASENPAIRQSSLFALDQIRTKNFLPQNLGARISCIYLKKFSPLQGPLQSTGVTSQQLTALAETLSHPSEFMTSCLDQDEHLDPRQSALQFNIQVDSPIQWNRFGFDFWNSVKIYTSWAWRYSDALKNWSPRFHRLLANINLEESLLLVPNGCESLMPPRCNQQTLTLNALRELAKKDSNPTEFDDLVPPGPDAKLLERGARSVNNDFLSTTAYDSASAWLSNFRKKFIETRWVMKNKVFNAHQNISLIAQAHDPQELSADIEALIASPAKIQDEVAYLCLEWRLSSDKKIDFLRSDIDQITALAGLAQLNTNIGLSISEQIHYFQKLSSQLEPLCNSLEQSNYFHSQGYTTNWLGLEAWAKELTKASLPEAGTLTFAAYVAPTGPYLSLSSNMNAIALCANAIDCARRILKSGVDLYAASTYAESFLPLSSHLPSAELFNPYSELKACQIYDPWFVQSKVQKVFVSDLVNTALVGWNPIPLYLDADFTAPKVTSLRRLISDGHLKYAPQVEKSKVTGSLLADFGPWLGAPCAVQISPDANKAFNFYAFNGISLNYCSSKKHYDGIAEKPGDIQMNSPSEPSVCTGCTLNFVATTSVASASGSGLAFNPLKFGIYLFRTLYRFSKGMQDKTNIPHSTQVRLDRILEAYNRYGHKIPDFCVDPLTDGYSCFQDICSSRLADEFETTFKVKPLEVTWTPDPQAENITGQQVQKVASLRIPQCDGELSLRFSCNENRGASSWWVQKRSLMATGSCRKFVRENL